MGEDADREGVVHRPRWARRHYRSQVHSPRTSALVGWKACSGVAVGRSGTRYCGILGITRSRPRAKLAAVRGRDAAMEGSLRKYRLRRHRREYRRTLYWPRSSSQNMDWAASGAGRERIRMVRLRSNGGVA